MGPRLDRRGLIGAAALMLAARPARAAPDSELVDPHWTGHDPDNGAVIDHGDWDAWLATRVVAGTDGINRIAYGDVPADARAALDRYTTRLAGTQVTAHARPEQMAFWINLYNALTVRLVLDAWPVASIRDVGGGLFTVGPWSDEVVEVESRALSLDDIEHGILRPVWGDSRIHYAVNCAALGCPNLRREAYRGGAIDRQLEEQAGAYVNHPRGIAFLDGDTVASRIYDWYRADFDGSESGVLRHLRRHAAPELDARLAGVEGIDRYRYDWALNDATPE